MTTAKDAELMLFGLSMALLSIFKYLLIICSPSNLPLATELLHSSSPMLLLYSHVVLQLTVKGLQAMTNLVMMNSVFNRVCNLCSANPQETSTFSTMSVEPMNKRHCIRIAMLTFYLENDWDGGCSTWIQCCPSVITYAIRYECFCRIIG